MSPPKGIETQLLSEPISRLGLSEFCILTERTSIRDTVERMREMNQNCAFILGDGSRIVGIFTDRDVLRKVAAKPDIWEEPVSTVMTPAPTTLPPTATTHEALKLMEEKHFRNVPVVNDRQIVLGNVNHFAVLKYLTDHFAEEIYNLPPDPDNYADQRDGG